MGINRVNHNRGMFYSIISGLFLGSVPIFIKNALVFPILTAEFFLNPFTWFAAVFGLVGFFLMQKAFYSGFVSIAVSIITGLSIIVPISISILLLNQALNFSIIGVIVIIIGVLMIGLGSYKK